MKVPKLHYSLSLLSGESEMGFIKNSTIKNFRGLIKSGAYFLQTFITDGS